MSLTKLIPERGTTLGTIFGKQRAQVNQAIGTGATVNTDFDISDFDLATVIVSMTGAATGDLGITVYPFEEDEANVPVAGLPVTAGTAVVSGGHVAQVLQVNVTGLKAIRVAVKNNNAGGQTIDFVDVYAGVTGTDF